MDDKKKLLIRRVLKREPLDEDTIKEVFEISDEDLENFIDELIIDGINIDIIKNSEGKQYYYIDQYTKTDKEFSLYIPNKVKIGIISDTHLGSKKDMLIQLNDFYDKLKDEGVKHVLHAGDIIDGMNIYRGHIYELKPEAIGIPAQIEYLEKYYPQRKGITTYFIRGNHDIDKQNKDINPMLLIKERHDLIYLGDTYKEILLTTRKAKDNPYKIALVHGDGGGAYSISYKAQTYIRGTPPKDRADMYVFGHWHQAGIFKYEGVYMILAGCFQKPTDYLIRKGLKGDNLGYIFEFKFKKDGNIEYLKPTIYEY